MRVGLQHRLVIPQRLLSRKSYPRMSTKMREKRKLPTLFCFVNLGDPSWTTRSSTERETAG